MHNDHTKTNTQDQRTFCFEDMAAAFHEETASLLDEETIEQCLKQEKVRFETAQNADIPTSWFTGNNPARYIKDTLRRCQPAPALHFLLWFLTEYATYLFLWILIRCTLHYLQGISSAFRLPVSLSVSPFVIALFLLAREYNKRYTRTHLTTENEPSALHKRIKKVRLRNNTLALTISLLLYGGFLLTNSSSLFSLSLWSAFLLETALLLITGLHNVFFNSHIIAFLEIGVTLVKPKSDSPDTACEKYLTLCKKDKSQSLQNVISHIKTYRIYLALAWLIMFALLISCIPSLWHGMITLKLCFLFAVSLISSLFLLLCILICTRLLRHCREF